MKKGITEPEVSETIRHLKETGLINDPALAEAIRREAITIKMLSKRGARRYMAHRGISQDIIDTVLDKEINSDIDNARSFVDKKMRVLHNYSPEIVKRRLYGLLSRRGYSPETIIKVLKEKIITKEVDER